MPLKTHSVTEITVMLIYFLNAHAWDLEWPIWKMTGEWEKKEILFHRQGLLWQNIDTRLIRRDKRIHYYIKCMRSNIYRQKI